VGVGFAVVLETFAIQIKGQLGDLLVDEFDIAGVDYLAT